MPDTADFMHVADERMWQIADATPEAWEAATRYVAKHAPDCLAALGMGGAS